MANTTVLYMRIDSDLKESAEAILKEIGISPSNAVTVFYKQIIKYRGLPFELRLSDETDSTQTDSTQTVRKTTLPLDALSQEDAEEKHTKNGSRQTKEEEI